MVGVSCGICFLGMEVEPFRWRGRLLASLVFRRFGHFEARVACGR